MLRGLGRYVTSMACGGGPVGESGRWGKGGSPAPSASGWAKAAAAGLGAPRQRPQPAEHGPLAGQAGQGEPGHPAAAGPAAGRHKQEGAGEVSAWCPPPQGRSSVYPYARTRSLSHGSRPPAWLSKVPPCSGLGRAGLPVSFAASEDCSALPGDCVEEDFRTGHGSESHTLALLGWLGEVCASLRM